MIKLKYVGLDSLLLFELSKQAKMFILMIFLEFLFDNLCFNLIMNLQFENLKNMTRGRAAW